MHVVDKTGRKRKISTVFGPIGVDLDISPTVYGSSLFC